MEWIDSHTHLNYEYPFSVAEYIENAKKVGVSKFITIGTEPDTLDSLRELAENHAEVFFSIGIHPHEAKFYDALVEEKMEKLVSHPKCVAIGEIGLDYYYEHSQPEDQRRAMKAQLEFALKWKKPVVIHARNSKDIAQSPSAEDEMLIEFQKYADRAADKSRLGVIHCFTGTQRFADECLKMGFYISFSGILTFKTASDLQRVSQSVPVERILLETDSPFLAPQPYRGKPNQSAYMVETAKVLAKLKNLTLAELSQKTVDNTLHLFGLH